jgi:hypothetical protein
MARPSVVDQIEFAKLPPSVVTNIGWYQSTVVGDDEQVLDPLEIRLGGERLRKPLTGNENRRVIIFNRMGCLLLLCVWVCAFFFFA